MLNHKHDKQTNDPVFIIGLLFASVNCVALSYPVSLSVDGIT